MSRGPYHGRPRGKAYCISLITSASYPEIVTNSRMKIVARHPIPSVRFFPLPCVCVNHSTGIVAQLPNGRAERMCSSTDLLIAQHLHCFVCERQSPIRVGYLFDPVFNRDGWGTFEEVPCRGKRTCSPNLDMRYMYQLPVRLKPTLTPLPLHITLPPKAFG
jgi:hypothetical protein